MFKPINRKKDIGDLRAFIILATNNKISKNYLSSADASLYTSIIRKRFIGAGNKFAKIITKHPLSINLYANSTHKLIRKKYGFKLTKC